MRKYDRLAEQVSAPTTVLYRVSSYSAAYLVQHRHVIGSLSNKIDRADGDRASAKIGTRLCRGKEKRKTSDKAHATFGW